MKCTATCCATAVLASNMNYHTNISTGALADDFMDTDLLNEVVSVTTLVWRAVNG